QPARHSPLISPAHAGKASRPSLSYTTLWDTIQNFATVMLKTQQKGRLDLVPASTSRSHLPGEPALAWEQISVSWSRKAAAGFCCRSTAGQAR
ncbi:hypothetical protein, partial [Devosia subaequoris]|uniref:hypothetical protein n=1 Tax=Devosia subaequoris TaxID=395930 RepID=UPI001AEF12B0